MKCEVVSESPLIRLYNGDCMEAMKGMDKNQYDLAIVDPPYGIGLDMIFNGAHGDVQKKKGGKKYQSQIHKRSKWNNAIPPAEYFELLESTSLNKIIWGCNYYAKHINAVGRIYHDKQMGIEGTKINFSHGDLASCSLQKRITVFRYRWSGNKQGDKINWFNTGIDKRIHPTQKPVALYRWLLQNYAKPGQTILDTHGGSMSIAIACYDLGHPLDLYELDEDYFKAGVKRVKQHIAQGQLFRPEQKLNGTGQQLTIEE